MPAVFRGLASVLLAVVVMFGGGCHPKPKAPALIDEPVFQSEQGFRLLVPEGWTMAARGNVPPGPIEKERLLVQYHRASGDSPATLEASVMDLPEEVDLTEYLSQPSFSVRRWKPMGQAESIEAGGKRGTRLRFSAAIGGKESTKEVAAFRRDGRVYLFTVLFSPKDATAPEQVRRSIDRLVWTK
jgi:hypothetical protein